LIVDVVNNFLEILWEGLFHGVSYCLTKIQKIYNK
jgi:hypothetical protein